MPARVIFDTDPGVDDSLALFLLLKSPELTLEAVTTVFGNVDLDQTTRNALIVLDLAGRPDIPVARGADRPLLRQAAHGGVTVFGENGMGGAELPTPSRREDSVRAACLIVDRVMAAPGEITLIAVGPLTNVALATRLEPRIVQNVKQLVVMGGAVTVPGNQTPVAEANFDNDPEAARIVAEAGYPLTIVGLDVTHKALMTPDELAIIRARGGEVGEFIHAISVDCRDIHTLPTGRTGMAMHDSLAVLYAIDPGYFSIERWYVEIDTQNESTAGMVIADRRGKLGRPPNANICLGIDADRFMSLYVERLTSGG